MLVLSRKVNQELVIGGNIRIKVIKAKGNTVRIGIEAPEDVRVVRGELKQSDDLKITTVIVDLNGSPQFSTDKGGARPTERAPKKPVNAQKTDRRLQMAPMRETTATENRMRQVIKKLAARQTKSEF